MPTKRRNSRATKRTRKSQKTNEDSSPELEEYEVEEIIGRRMNGETGLNQITVKRLRDLILLQRNF